VCARLNLKEVKQHVEGMSLVSATVARHRKHSLTLESALKKRLR
jgi:hypothetical protein